MTEVSIVAIWPICGLHAGRRDDHRRGAARHRGVLEQHVRAVAERRRRSPGRTPRVLGDRRALAGERRLLRLQRRRADDPPVGRDDVAGLDLHDVAGHDVDRRDAARPCRRAPPSPAAPAGSTSASTLARAFSSWREPSTTLSRSGAPTMTPVETSPMTKLTTATATSMMFIGSRSCCERDRPHRRRLLRGDLVRSVLRAPRGCLRSREALSRIDRQRRGRVLRGTCVPVGYLGRRRSCRHECSSTLALLSVAPIADTAPSQVENDPRARITSARAGSRARLPTS